MASIACGHCGGRHASVAEVRACAGTHPHAGGDGPAPADAGWADGAPFDFDEPPFDLPDDAAAPGWDVPPARPARADVGPVAARRGPVALGRNVVVRPGAPAPAGWEGAERLAVTGAPGQLDALRARWLARTPTVIELDDRLAPADDVDDPARPTGTETREPWQLAPSFGFDDDELRHLVWSNSVDGRHPGRLRWRWAEDACRLGATPAPDGAEADVVLPDGRAAVCDGGPVAPLTGEALGSPDLAVVHRISLEHGSLRPLEHPDALPSGLAPDQAAAVSHPGGPARIIAPAGSGKTRVLSERARLLHHGWRLPASAITVVAYNVRARQELRERTTGLPAGRIDTLNALGRKILDGQAPFAPRRDRRTVLDERGVRSLLDSLVSLPRKANTDPAAVWIEALSTVRLGLRDPAQVEADAGGELDGLPDVFARYRAALRERGLADFDEQIYGAVEALLTEPATRAAAQRACRLLLVDEFQDLTPAHLLMVRLLGAPEGAVFGVGDDDQTIYGYAGASPDWLIGYAGLFPGAGDHPLEVNYRCPPAVVRAAATLLGHNTRRVAKVIRPAPGRAADDGGLRVVVDADTVAATVAQVRRALDEGRRPSEVAVLARVNASLAPVQVALAHHGVPVAPAVEDGYLRRTGVAAALAWLRLATRPGRFGRGDVAATTRRPSRGLSPRVGEWMAEQRDLDGLRRLAGRLQGRDADKVQGYADDVAMLAALADRAGTAELLRAVRDRVGLDAALDSLDASKGGLRGSAQGDDLDALVALGRLHPDPTTFGEWLRASLVEGGAPADAERVTLATVHAVKGQEWPVVVVHEASAGLFPHRLSEDDEEERRVFHVAVTRASAQACVVAPAGAASPFVGQLTTAFDPTARPTPAARAAAMPAARRAPASAPPDGASGPLADALRSWRRARAADDGVPPYVVFHDSTLEAIAQARPTSLVGLGRIKGIGPAKLARYGPDILAVLGAEAG